MSSNSNNLSALVLAATLALAAKACNLYDAAYPDRVYLCADETCTIAGDSSLQCQSGCCWDG